MDEDNAIDIPDEWRDVLDVARCYEYSEMTLTVSALMKELGILYDKAEAAIERLAKEQPDRWDYCLVPRWTGGK